MRSRRADALGLLGLARRAGAVAAGVSACRQAVREGRAHLVLMAEDASAGQTGKIERTLLNRPIPRVILGDRATLGAAVGLGPLTAVAVTVASFADQIRNRLGGPDPGVGGASAESEDGRRDAGH